MTDTVWKSAGAIPKASSGSSGCSADLNYENLLDNEYLMRILAPVEGASESGGPEGKAGGASNGSSQSPADLSNDLLEQSVRRLFG